MIELLHLFVAFWDGVVLWYFAGLNLVYGVLFLLSLFEMWRNWALTAWLGLHEKLDREAFRPISILIPAFNEKKTIEATVRSQLSLRYPSFEVVVVNDGSQDGTLAVLKGAFDLYEVPPAFPRRLETAPVRAYYRSRTTPRLLVVDKEKGGKADALNAGLNAARYPLCATVDADTLIDPDALPRIVRPFLLHHDVAAAGGTIRVANGCRFNGGAAIDPRVSKRLLVAVQVPEYLRAFLFGRMGWNRLGGNLLVSGAFGLYRRDLLIEIGGYHAGSVTEDLEMTVRLHRYLLENKIPYRLPFVPDPVAWTEVPSDLRSLGRQRARWHRGLITTLIRERRILGNPRYRKIGLLVYPFFFLGEMLAPVFEVIGYGVVALGIGLGILSSEYALAFFGVAFGYMMLLTIWTICLEEMTYRAYPRLEDFFRLLLAALLEPFGYRQLTLSWRLRGFWQAFWKLRDWGHIRREGIPAEAEVAPAPSAAAAAHSE